MASKLLQGFLAATIQLVTAPCVCAVPYILAAVGIPDIFIVLYVAAVVALPLQSLYLVLLAYRGQYILLHSVKQIDYLFSD
jgi:predicted tellurium resistance membrane protein TerC